MKKNSVINARYQSPQYSRILLYVIHVRSFCLYYFNAYVRRILISFNSHELNQIMLCSSGETNTANS